MSPRATLVCLVALLGVIVAEVGLLAYQPSSFATLPIFVPVSLEYERQMRAERGQPARRGGEEAMQLAASLERSVNDGRLTPEEARALTPHLQAIARTRAAILDARGRRHNLNIALMDVGVAATRVLTPAQWDAVHMTRDGVRAGADAVVLDRLLKRLACYSGTSQNAGECP